MKNIIVIRKNGTSMNWCHEKIQNAVSLSGMTIQKELTQDFLSQVSKEVFDIIQSRNIHIKEDNIYITVENIHNIVMEVLKSLNDDVYKQYRDYRNYKQRYYKSFENIKDEAIRIVNYNDNENANKDSKIISTKKELTAGVTSQELALEYEIPKASAKAHKDGKIYIHDLRDLIFGSINCCTFDLGSVIKGGFELNGIYIEEPDSFETFMDLTVDIMLVASSQQFGGFSIPRLDEVGAPYLERTFSKFLNELLGYGIDYHQAEELAEEKTWKITLKKMRMFEYKVNVVNNSTGQTPFLSVSYGLGINKFSKMISKAMLEVRMEGMGTKKVTAIFPKLIFLHKDSINGSKNSPNYDIKKLSIKCSSKCQYPDWFSLDGKFPNSPGEVYDRCGKAITAMGCRATLSPWYNKNGEEIYDGRFNIGAVSILLVRNAIDSNKDEAKFFELLQDSFDKSLDVLLYRYAKLSKQKASSNPLLFTQGGCAIKLDPQDTIEKALECATASIGYLGLEEATYYMTGKHLHENIEFGKKVMDFLKTNVDKAAKETGKLIALYGTPAEGLCMKALNKDKNDFGIIEGVTDKEWYTNSFHLNVKEEVTSIEKTNAEYEFYKYSSGGRIMYVEWPHTENLEAIEQYLDYAMSKGLYVGINFDNGTCNDCGAKGAFIDGYCTICNSTNVLVINRVCG